MASSCFIGTESLEPSGKTVEDFYKEYSANFGMIRRKAAEPRYIIIGIDYRIPSARKEVVIGDWY